MSEWYNVDLSVFEGAIIQGIDGLVEDSGQVLLGTTHGTLEMFHEQDCCEHVRISQVDGDVQKHIGSCVLAIKEKVVRNNDAEYVPIDDYEDSETATFYTIVTTRGYLDFRWQGSSNGYYSEGVDLKHHKGETL